MGLKESPLEKVSLSKAQRLNREQQRPKAAKYIYVANSTSVTGLYHVAPDSRISSLHEEVRVLAEAPNFSESTGHMGNLQVQLWHQWTPVAMAMCPGTWVLKSCNQKLGEGGHRPSSDGKAARKSVASSSTLISNSGIVRLTPSQNGPPESKCFEMLEDIEAARTAQLKTAVKEDSRAALGKR
ncbi:hypothetical protein H920_06149 [Fukomys damarensis]|uniref:Uncharacterized protein n=1 Tax=Fukomys damarensis TaxID=885580 RepID=A0A091DQ99_FUKDA|nr:hypothetical protein H920_06149 [Fukomys damarensis]